MTVRHFICLMIALVFAAQAMAADNRFVRAKGRALVVGADDAAIHLRGVNLGDEYVVTPEGQWWMDDPNDLGIPALNKFSDSDFRAIAALGMNVVRDNLSYRIFEDNQKPYVYKKAGWQWLDRRVALAKKHGLYLILSMMVPQGGYQPSGGGGAEQWDNLEKQKRLKALWKAIAKRYRGEPQIAGYDLLNEPNTTRSGHQWKKLAQELVNEIRAVDQNHMIIVESVNWVVSAAGASPESPDVLAQQQFMVDDPRGARNIMYDFHFYLPMSYTHQLVPWGSQQDGGRYPDGGKEENTYEAEGHYLRRMMPRNKAYLENEILYFMKFGKRNNVPMNIGEWGANPMTCVANKGCFAYTADMLNLLHKHGLNYNFFTYDWIRISDYEENELLGDYPGAAGVIRDGMKRLFRAALKK